MVLRCWLGGGIASGQHLIEGVTAARVRLNDQTPVVDDEANACTGVQISRVAGGTASITDPPAFRRLVVCNNRLSDYIGTDQRPQFG